jgi:putative transposase
MQYQPETLYHVFNRGNNRQQLFFNPNNYLYFLGKLRTHVRPICPILGYCLMPNHFHLLLCPGEEAVAPMSLAGGVPRSRLAGALSTVLSSFAQGLNKQHGRTGVWFEGRTQARELSGAEYPGWCLQYIHQNPVRAGLTVELSEWPYSSYRDYAGLRGGTLCNLEMGSELLDVPADPQQFRQEAQRALDPEHIRGLLYGARRG